MKNINDFYYTFEEIKLMILEDPELLKFHLKKLPSKNTINNYLNIYKRFENFYQFYLEHEHSDPIPQIAFLKTLHYTGSSLNTAVTAIKHNLNQQIITIEHIVSHELNSIHKTEKNHIDKINYLRHTISEINKFKAASPKLKERNRSRQEISLLPDDWREQLGFEMYNKSKYFIAYCISVITGCRPGELTSEVSLNISFHPENTLDIHIICNKNKTSSEKVRVLKYRISSNCMDSFFLHNLLQHVHTSWGTFLFHIDNSNSFTSNINYHAKQIFKHLTFKVGPAHLRDAFAADIKKGFKSDVDVAIALGHSSTISNKNYALARQSNICKIPIPCAVECNFIVEVKNTLAALEIKPEDDPTYLP